jgi:2,4-dienoyl-CoA reductase-like NADH-dependent reductase (Old Yellow Enzyme family)
MSTAPTSTTVLAEPLQLPCGLVLPNRIVKGAMAEGLGNAWTADVTPSLIRLYERWAYGGTGTLITGMMSVQRGVEDNVIVALDHRTNPDALRRWAEAVHRRDVRLIGQIQHPGRQVPIYMARHPVAPSALPPVRGSRLFGSSRALTDDEITDLVERFGAAAAMLEQAGFDGVELHAAHGYLIGQFLSPETNLRDDGWGGDLQRRARFLVEIIRAVRQRVAPGFAVAVKINSSDFRPGGFDIEDSAHVVGMLGDEGVDLVEISGGTYESASGCLGVLPGEPGTSAEAYFAGMAPRLRAMTDVPLALTGGLRSRQVMEQLLTDGTVDLIGLARPLVQQPDLSGCLLDGSSTGIELSPCPVKGLNELFWWISQFQNLADGKDFDPGYTPRQVQLNTVVGMLRQIAADARSRALDRLGSR